MEQRILFVMNSDKYFVLNRLGLAEKALKEGYHVSAALPVEDLASSKRIKEAGVTLYSWPISRRGLPFFDTLRSLYCLYRILRIAKPDIVHSLTIKPVILSGLLCRLLNVSLVALIPGRGSAFSHPMLAPLATWLYRHSLRSPTTRVCFQNPDDFDFFVSKNIVQIQRALVIPGSGVNTERFSYKTYPVQKKKRVITCAARMLKEKGIIEYIRAAELVQSRRSDVSFRLAGAPDPGNPSSLQEQELKQLCAKANVAYLGHVEDMPQLLEESDLFCLPSYYPEGIPMTLLQAASMGKALITTDVTGCREVVIDQETGLLIPPRDSAALAKAIDELLDRPLLCQEMARKCRLRLEKLFSESIIHRKTLSLYEEYSS